MAIGGHPYNFSDHLEINSITLMIPATNKNFIGLEAIIVNFSEL